VDNASGRVDVHDKGGWRGTFLHNPVPPGSKEAQRGLKVLECPATTHWLPTGDFLCPRCVRVGAGACSCGCGCGCECGCRCGCRWVYDCARVFHNSIILATYICVPCACEHACACFHLHRPLNTQTPTQQMHARTCGTIHLKKHTYTHIHTRMHTRAHTHIHMHTHTKTHTHTHNPGRWCATFQKGKSGSASDRTQSMRQSCFGRIW